MKALRVLCFIGFLSFTGCLHYNYAVRRSISPVPYANLYSSDDKNDYEFSSVLYATNPDSVLSGSSVEIVHMSDLHGDYVSTLSFHLQSNESVFLLPNTVQLEHLDSSRKKIEALSYTSTLEKCFATNACSGHFAIRYRTQLPKRIFERVSFVLLIDGEERKFEYEIPLEYKYEYSFFDVLMGV